MLVNVGRYSFNKIIDFFILSKNSQVKQTYEVKTSVAYEDTD